MFNIASNTTKECCAMKDGNAWITGNRDDSTMNWWHQKTIVSNENQHQHQDQFQYQQPLLQM
jgi:hypothetical protein